VIATGLMVILLICVIIFLSLSFSDANCELAKLKAAVDFFLSAAGPNTDIPDCTFKLTNNATITQDNVQYSSLDETVHSNITGFLVPFRLQIIDTETCNVATLTVPIQGLGLNSVNAITSLRIKIE
jgi:hypothetical protein